MINIYSLMKKYLRPDERDRPRGRRPPVRRQTAGLAKLLSDDCKPNALANGEA